MKSPVKEPVLFLVLLLTMLMSCGPSPQAGGGIGGTGNTATVVSGPITNTSSNSVSVSEYDYSTGSTVMTVDGTSGNQRDLKKGMVVLVNATLTHNYGTNDPPQRTAHTLFYEDTVEGIVQSVAPDGSSLVVLGQTVAITTATIIDATIPGQNILSLMPGRDLVEVSGFVTGDGTIVGTLIELKPIDLRTEVPDYEVKGFIKNHDAIHKTFDIGSLSVDYRNAELKDMPSQSTNAWNGLLVDVRGNQVSSGGSGPHGVQIIATKVKLEGLGTEDSEGAEIQGFVTQVVALGDFYLGNVHVQTTPSTVYDHGTINEIILGVKLEVAGPLDNGVVRATKIEFKNDSQIQADLETVTLGSGSAGLLTFAGLQGLTVQTDNQTKIEGEGSARNLNDLASGDHLKIHGRSSGTGFTATKIERTSPTSDYRIEGPIGSASNPMMSILGTSIDTSSLTDTSFKDRTGYTIGRSAFFRTLLPSTVVGMEGQWVSGALRWDKARLKN